MFDIFFIYCGARKAFLLILQHTQSEQNIFIYIFRENKNRRRRASWRMRRRNGGCICIVNAEHSRHSCVVLLWLWILQARTMTTLVDAEQLIALVFFLFLYYTPRRHTNDMTMHAAGVWPDSMHPIHTVYVCAYMRSGTQRTQRGLPSRNLCLIFWLCVCLCLYVFSFYYYLSFNSSAFNREADTQSRTGILFGTIQY